MNIGSEFGLMMYQSEFCWDQHVCEKGGCARTDGTQNLMKTHFPAE